MSFISDDLFGIHVGYGGGGRSVGRVLDVRFVVFEAEDLGILSVELTKYGDLRSLIQVPEHPQLQQVSGV